MNIFNFKMRTDSQQPRVIQSDCMKLEAECQSDVKLVTENPSFYVPGNSNSSK